MPGETEFVPDLPKFGRFQVVRTLGSGAMGTVYLAWDAVLGREVAIKTLRVQHQGDPQHKRFFHEARAIGALVHPNVIAIYDMGTQDGVPYLVMEIATGGSLRDRLAQGRLPTSIVREIGVQIGHALVAAHEREILHRDIKPANVLAASDGRWKLADFGIARLPDSTLTVAGQFLGSPSYAAPESLRSGIFGPSSDVYGLAALLYEAIAGEPPHGHGDISSVIRSIDSGIAPELPVGVDASLARAVTRALSVDPSRRPAASAFVALLSESAGPDAPQDDGAGTMVWNRSPTATAPVPSRREAFGGRRPPLVEEVRETKFALPPVPEGEKDEDIIPTQDHRQRKWVVVSAFGAVVAAIAGVVYLAQRSSAGPTGAEKPAPISATAGSSQKTDAGSAGSATTERSGPIPFQQCEERDPSRVVVTYLLSWRDKPLPTPDKIQEWFPLAWINPSQVDVYLGTHKKGPFVAFEISRNRWPVWSRIAGEATGEDLCWRLGKALFEKGIRKPDSYLQTDISSGLQTYEFDIKAPRSGADKPVGTLEQVISGDAYLKMKDWMEPLNALQTCSRVPETFSADHLDVECRVSNPRNEQVSAVVTARILAGGVPQDEKSATVTLQPHESKPVKMVFPDRAEDSCSCEAKTVP